MSIFSFLKGLFKFDASCFIGQGSTGAKVLQVETKLQQLGYYSGKLDSSYGPILTASVNKYQKDHGMKQYGCIDTNTWKLLFPPTPVDDGWRYVPSFTDFHQINGYDCGPTSMSMGLTELFPGSGDRQVELEKYADTTSNGTTHAGLQQAFLKEMELKGLKGEYYERGVSEIGLTDIASAIQDKNIFIIAHGNTKGWPTYWLNAYGHYVYPVGVNIKTGQFKIADPTKGVIIYSETEFENGLKLIVGQKSYLFFKVDR
jgi:peptidoglycan hydrolase-like protein with peptidoglycan-binding domain